MAKYKHEAMEEKLKTCIDYIVDFAETNNYLPCVREIAEGLGVAESTARAWFNEMEARKMIERKNKGRGSGIRSYSIKGLCYVDFR